MRIVVLALRVWGLSLADPFVGAARGMYGLMCDLKDRVVSQWREIQLDGYDVAWPQLREKLAARLSESSSKTVVIKGDAAVRLGRTVAVMDLARQLGAVQLALAARPGADGGANP